MSDVLTISISVIASVIAATLISRIRRTDKNDADIVRIKTTLQERSHQRKTEDKHLEYRLKAIDFRLKQLGDRYHDMRGVVDRCARILKERKL